MTLGSDGETAMIKATSIAFPQESFRLCARHVKHNVRQHLKNVPDKERKTIVNGVFDERTGLANVSTLDKYDEISNNLSDDYDDYPHFQTYFVNTLCKKLRDFVVKPRIEKKEATNWTNNNCELSNHQLKMNLAGNYNQSLK